MLVHAMKVVDSTMMYGGNASFIEALYEQYLKDPQSVSQDWKSYFDQLRNSGPGADIPHTPIKQTFEKMSGQRVRIVETQGSSSPIDLERWIDAYRTLGHLRAQVDPLKLHLLDEISELHVAQYGNPGGGDRSLKSGPFEGSIPAIERQLQETYCASVGFEYMYLPKSQREWLQTRIEEHLGRRNWTSEQKKRTLWKLTAAEGLERHLHVQYVGQKRFSLEGSEVVVPVLDHLINRIGHLGGKEMVLGMAHRGRLNVLVNILGKNPKDLFAEFEGKKSIHPEISGDVKYHMGFSSDVQTEGGPVHLVLAFNPSHLEIVGPVVEGSVRARQDRQGDNARNSVVPVLIHGDAAVAGQGVVAETLNLSQLRGFKTGGTVHIVINNQVGFTVSDPLDARSSRYCTDIAKCIDAPVFHVNGDDPEACLFAAELALDYRMTWNSDVFIDLVSFRRHGHNESDEPSMTQPMMYQTIKAHPGIRSLYAGQLQSAGVLTDAETQDMVRSYQDLLDQGVPTTEAVRNPFNAQGAAKWKSHLGYLWTEPASTACSLEHLREVGEVLVRIPEGFQLQRAVEREIKSRAEMLEGSVSLNWGMAENLAYATLLSQGYRVRLCGQDSGRGTFVHRHAVWHDQGPSKFPEGTCYIPLNHLSENQAPFEVIDSTLSEEAVLAYEYGYASTEPGALVIWEAQFGDFVNGAQAVIDQFISAGESKWQRLCGLTLMLPHGYEGQGPEHSSARLERFLQLCAENNMQIVVPSTPAQMFHVLRRQMVRPYRKPLVLFSPKSLLRNKYSVSTLGDLTEGRFQNVIADTTATSGVERVVVSSGKLYWELFEAREKSKTKGVALVRLEQLYPFPHEELRAALGGFSNAQVVWAQEEPYNQGAWLMIRDDLQACLDSTQTLGVSSRPTAAAPAVGYSVKHVQQQQELIESALGLARVARGEKQ
ncbi:MAG: 2-oxoglutarate dehydrogenase E1 component [Deinococcaceae bacterium]